MVRLQYSRCLTSHLNRPGFKPGTGGKYGVWISCKYILGLIFWLWANIKASPVSSLICDWWLFLGIRVHSIVAAVILIIECYLHHQSNWFEWRDPTHRVGMTWARTVCSAKYELEEIMPLNKVAQFLSLWVENTIHAVSLLVHADKMLDKKSVLKTAALPATVLRWQRKTGKFSIHSWNTNHINTVGR